MIWNKGTHNHRHKKQNEIFTELSNHGFDTDDFTSIFHISSFIYLVSLLFHLHISFH